MEAQVKISFCQKDEYKNCIEDFVKNLHANNDLSVEFHDLNTIVTGTYDKLFVILKDELLKARERSGFSNFSLKLDVKFMNDQKNLT